MSITAKTGVFSLVSLMPTIRGCLYAVVILGLFLSSASSDSLTAVKSKIYFVPGKDFEVSWFYNVSRGSQLPESVKFWAHLNNGSSESSLLWTIVIQELDNGLNVQMTENKMLSTNPLFKVFYGKTQLRHDSIGYTHQYDLLIQTPPSNTSLYDFSCAVFKSMFYRFEKKVKIIKSVNPRILSSFQNNIIIRKGERVQLKCLASGIPKPKVIWTRLYESGPVVQSEGTEEASLIITDIQPENTGTYTCVSRNLGGRIEKDVAITVSYLEIDAMYGRLHRGQLGKPLRVDCPILGYPEPDYSWKRHGGPFSPSKSLTFDSLSKSDFGNYTCTAFNQVGQIGTFVLIENMDTTIASRRNSIGALRSDAITILSLIIFSALVAIRSNS